MNICEFENRDNICNLIVRDLRVIGIKHRQKKFTHKPEKGISKRIFKVPLSSLPAECVALNNGYHIRIPRFVHEACTIIRQHLDTEGLFRKAGSTVRQKEIKLQLDKKGKLEKVHNVIDIANVLKLFFRELPEPLIPYTYHDTFLHCLRLDKSKSLYYLLNVCLLLPFDNICTLMYVTEFLQTVARNADRNKMDVCNLAIILTPNLMPLDPQMKMETHSNQRLSCHVRVVQILIENAERVGIIPEDIVEKLSLGNCGESSEDLVGDYDEKKKKKKRRSGSLTRMFNGLKKIVSGKIAGEDEVIPRVASSPDLHHLTPVLASKSGSKRKATDTFGLSSKKKRDVIELLPKGSLLSDTPKRLPERRSTLSKWFTTSTPKNNSNAQFHDTRRSLLSLHRHRSKSKCSNMEDPEDSDSGLKRLERRWSVISSATAWAKKRKLAENIPLTIINTPDSTIPDLTQEEIKPINDSVEDEIEFVRIPKLEYEEIKNRVSAIENQITEEFEKDGTTFNKVDEVQTKYEQTLEEAETLQADTSTDQLTKRLSRELKIRQKVIRSPSARKIGTIRRRSKEFEKKQNDLTRSALKRGRPNTVLTGLKHPSPTKLINDSLPLVSTLGTPKSEDIQWRSADNYFYANSSQESSIGSRASLAKIRAQNAGMVLAKAKLFDNLVDSPSRNRNRRQSRMRQPKSLPRRNKQSPKGGGRMHRDWWKDGCVENKENDSPFRESNRRKCFDSPKLMTPQIKKALKTPKNLKIPATPLVESRGKTPLRGIHGIQTPQRFSPRLLKKSRQISSVL